MKRTFLTLSLIVISCIGFAQTQQGIVKTRGRMNANGSVIAGVRLSGTTISLRNSSSYVTGNKGTFSFVVPSKTFSLSSVKKNGYQLCDHDLIGRGLSYSSNPLVIVMETPDNTVADRLVAEKKIRRTLSNQLQEKEDEIDELKRQKKISDQEYNKLIQELYENQKKNENLIEEMAQRYSTIDFDELNDFQRKVAFFIQNGELTRADSLLNTRGSMEERSAELDRMDAAIIADAEELVKRQKAHKKSLELKAKTLLEFAADCYSKFEICKMKHKNDSAAYWLELRSNKDTLNIEWMLDAGSFIDQYLADYSRANQYYQRALTNAIVQYGEIHPYVAKCYSNLATLSGLKGQYPEAKDYLRKTIEIRDILFGENSQEQINSYDKLGALFYEAGDIKMAMDCFTKALSISADTNNELDIASINNNIAGICKSQTDYAKALNYYQNALNSYIKIYGEDTPEVANIYNNIGTTLKDKGDYTQSIEYLFKALNVGEKIFDGKHPILSTIYNNLSVVYSNCNKDALAKDYLEKALVIEREVFGDYHPNVALVLSNLGGIYSDLDMNERANECFEKSKDIFIKLYGEDYYRLADLYNNIGMCYKNQGEYLSALPYFQKALDITLRTFGEENSQILIYTINLGIIHRLLGDSEKSMEYYKYALHVATEIQTENPNIVATIYNSIGLLYYSQEKYQEAYANFNNALSKRVEAFGKEHPGVPRLYGNIAEIHIKQKNYEQAVISLKEEIGIEIKLYGEDSQEVFETANMIGYTYFLAKEENIDVAGFEDFMSEVVTVGITAEGDYPATQQGMSGEYVILEYEDWSVEQLRNIKDVVKEYQNKPKNIVVMKNDTISKHFFEDVVGMQFVLKYVGKESRQKTIKTYRQWNQS